MTNTRQRPGPESILLIVIGSCVLWRVVIALGVPVVAWLEHVAGQVIG